MAVITKYRLELSELALTVSNDVFSGEFILDSDIVVKMNTGRSGASFKVKIYDLPQAKLEALRDSLTPPDPAPPHPVPIKIDLGYFDGDFEPVLEGLVSKLKAEVKDGKLVATLTGLESGTHALKKTEVDDTPPDPVTTVQAIQNLLENTPITQGTIEEGVVIQPANLGADQEPAVRTLEGKLIAVIDELVRQTTVTEGEAVRRPEMLVGDGKLRIGLPLADDSHQLELVPDENLAGFQPAEEGVPGKIQAYNLKPVAAQTMQSFHFVALGDPKLRPAQKLIVGVEGYDEIAGAEFRVTSLAHSYTLTGGYVCKGYAVKRCTTGDCRRQQRSARQPSAEEFAARLNGVLEDLPSKRPFVDVGKVKETLPGSGDPGHRASLYFRQRSESTETQPSIRVAVEENDEHVHANKPMVSPFAWHKCGLVVPVYPGMRAVMLHNLGLKDDALVGGFIWSEEPAMETPRSEQGDYWLCLPVEAPDDGPADDTKAVNDLTAGNGRRVIEAKGVKIKIGAGRLGNVGVRPEEGADDELVIDHASGTEIRVDADGKVTIKAEGGLEIEGDVKIKDALEVAGNTVFKGNVDIQ